MKTTIIFLIALVCATSKLSLQANVYSGHNHNHGKEREIDGAFSPRDHGHWDGEEHNDDFDHEAILGSAREAEEFDHLPPAEAKKRLGVLLLKMDLNEDRVVSPVELKQWILRSFRSLSEEESKEKLQEVDLNRDGEVTWAEYVSETYGVESEEDASLFTSKEHQEEQKLMANDKELFNAADLDKNGRLDAKEFIAFTHPEEAPHMLDVILKQTLDEKDLNKDGYIDFQEYIGERGMIF